MWLQIGLIILKAVAIYTTSRLKNMDNGIPKEVATKLMDAVAQSQANNVPVDAFDALKEAL